MKITGVEVISFHTLLSKLFLFLLRCQSISKTLGRYTYMYSQDSWEPEHVVFMSAVDLYILVKITYVYALFINEKNETVLYRQ